MSQEKENKQIKSPYSEKDPRFTESELELLKKLDDETLRMMRSVFYQDVLTEAQLERFKNVLTPDLVTVLKKFFLTPLDWNEPLFSMANRWSNPKYEQLLVKEVRLVVTGRQKAIEFLKDGVERLTDIASGGAGSPKPQRVDIRVEKDYVSMTDEEAKIEIVAMQDSIQFLESALMSINMYVISPEDKQDIIRRLKQNSAR